MNINSLIQSNSSFVTHRACAASPSHWLRAALPTILVLALAPFATASDKHAGKPTLSNTNETLFLELQQDIPSVDFVTTPVIE